MENSHYGNQMVVPLGLNLCHILFAPNGRLYETNVFSHHSFYQMVVPLPLLLCHILVATKRSSLELMSNPACYQTVVPDVLKIIPHKNVRHL